MWLQAARCSDADSIVQTGRVQNKGTSRLGSASRGPQAQSCFGCADVDDAKRGRQTWHVRCQCDSPGGQKLLAEVEVTSSDATVELSPESGDLSPHESHEQRHFLGAAFGVKKPIASYTEMEFKKVPRRQTRPARISLLSDRDPMSALTASSGRNPAFQPLDGGVQYDYHEFAMYPEGVRNYLEVVQPEGSATRVALPASNAKRCFVVLRATSPEVTSTDVHLENVEADLLLRGSQTGRQVSIAEESEILSPQRLLFENSEEMVRQKMADPVAAAVGAYTLLSWREIPRLRDLVA